MEENIGIEDLYLQLKKLEKVMVTKAELSKVVETFSVMSNSETMQQVGLSEKDIENGRVKKITSASEI